MKAWFPAPLLSLAVFVVWLLLAATLDPAHLLLAAVLAVLLPLAAQRLRSERAGIRRPLLAVRLMTALLLVLRLLMLGLVPAPGLMPSEERLSEVFSEIGLTPDTTVVAYDDEGGGWAGRLIWTLDVLGHRQY